MDYMGLIAGDGEWVVGFGNNILSFRRGGVIGVLGKTFRVLERKDSIP